MKPAIAFFDFDGTITTKDTLLEFIRFSRGNRAYLSGMLSSSPYLAAYKAKFISNQLAKEKVLRHFFSGMELETFNDYCQRFSREKIPEILRPLAMKKIKEFQANGTKTVIVSASPENWVHLFAASYGGECLATRLVLENNKLTGQILGRNCYGEEKVNRIKSTYDLSQYEEIYAFGDSAGDKQMLAMATRAYYKPF